MLRRQEDGDEIMDEIIIVLGTTMELPELLQRALDKTEAFRHHLCHYRDDEAMTIRWLHAVGATVLSTAISIRSEDEQYCFLHDFRYLCGLDARTLLSALKLAERGSSLEIEQMIKRGLRRWYIDAWKLEDVDLHSLEELLISSESCTCRRVNQGGSSNSEGLTIYSGQ